ASKPPRSPFPVVGIWPREGPGSLMRTTPISRIEPSPSSFPSILSQKRTAAGLFRFSRNPITKSFSGGPAQTVSSHLHSTYWHLGHIAKGRRAGWAILVLLSKQG